MQLEEERNLRLGKEGRSGGRKSVQLSTVQVRSPAASLDGLQVFKLLLSLWLSPASDWSH